MFGRKNNKSPEYAAPSCQFKAGDIFYRAGESGNAVFRVLSGNIRLTDPNGQEHFLGEGDYFGFHALRSEPYPEDAAADTEGEAEVISRKLFSQWQKHAPEYAHPLLTQMSETDAAVSPAAPPAAENPDPAPMEAAPPPAPAPEESSAKMPVYEPPSPAPEPSATIEKAPAPPPTEEPASAQEETFFPAAEPSLPMPPEREAKLPPPAPVRAPAPSAPADFSAIDRLGEALMKMTETINACAARMEKSPESANNPESFSGVDEAHIDQLTEKIVNKIQNLGVIQPLIEDETVNDILINGTASIYIERSGKLEPTGLTIPRESEVFALAKEIAKAVGRVVDPRRPLVDARLLDGSRVNIIAPPLAVDGTTISIRKFSSKKYTLEKMVEQNNMPLQLAQFFQVIAACRLNVIISGGTGSGKTTLLNAVSQHIGHDERVVTIEDAAELQLKQPHVVRLETRPFMPGVTRDEEVSMRDLVKNALRMRPDRIIVGEVRGAEAFDMMQAMNTGHEGSLTTIHANHPRDALARLENMIGMANLHIPIKAVRMQIASALQLVIQVSRMRDGLRRITYVSEIVGMENDIIVMQDLFRYYAKGETPEGTLVGDFVWSGIMPRFLRRVHYYKQDQLLSQALGVPIPKM